MDSFLMDAGSTWFECHHLSSERIHATIRWGPSGPEGHNGFSAGEVHVLLGVTPNVIVIPDSSADADEDFIVHVSQTYGLRGAVAGLVIAKDDATVDATVRVR